MPNQQRDQIFISYSHNDIEWLDRLQIHLKPLCRNRAITIWVDRNIRTGQQWRDEIEKALKAARVAVLLVTPHFLASDFIVKVELPKLLEAAKLNGLIIVWLAVSASSYTDTPIENYQCANDPEHPIDSLTEADRNKVLVEIAEKIAEAVHTLDAAFARARAPVADRQAHVSARLPVSKPMRGGLQRAAWLALSGVGVGLLTAIAFYLRPFSSNVPAPSDFKLKLAVRLNEKFGPVDPPPVMLLAHRKPKASGTNYLSTATAVKDRYEYESPIYMPSPGEQYYGLLNREVQSAVKTQPHWTEACFVHKAGSRGQDPIVRLGCDEGGSCQVAPDDLGWAAACPPTSNRLNWPSLIPVAFAQSRAVVPTVAWLVPSIETLSKQEGEGRNPPFTEFLLSSGPITSLSKGKQLTYTVRVNSTPIYIDGLPPDTSALPFEAAKGISVRFGLENLDFSGQYDGFEDIEVTLQFNSDNEVIRKAVVHLRYVALRPMPATAANSTADAGLRIQWRAIYHPGRAQNVYQIFLLSSGNATAVADVKRRIDAAKLSLGRDTFVAVIRPPLANNGTYGVALGIRQPSGQVQFTFDDQKSRQLCQSLVQMRARSSLIHGTAFRRDVENGNLSKACTEF